MSVKLLNFYSAEIPSKFSGVQVVIFEPRFADSASVRVAAVASNKPYLHARKEVQSFPWRKAKFLSEITVVAYKQSSTIAQLCSQVYKSVY